MAGVVWVAEVWPGGFILKTDGSNRPVPLGWVTLLPTPPHPAMSSLMWVWSSGQHFGIILSRTGLSAFWCILLLKEVPVWSCGGPGFRNSDLSHTQRRRKGSLLRTVDQGGILLWTSKKNNVKQVFLQLWDICKANVSTKSPPHILVHVTWQGLTWRTANRKHLSVLVGVQQGLPSLLLSASLFI